MSIKALALSLAKSKPNNLALLGIPDDSNSSFCRGPSKAPTAIRDQLFSDAFNMWTETGIELSEDVLFDAGDLKLEKLNKPWVEIEGAIALLLESNLVPLCLGGDHAITYPIIKAFSATYDRLNILQFDAHPDLYDDFDDNPHSHASPFARIMENDLVDRLVQIGVRAITDHQREQAERLGVEMLEMRKLPTDLSLSFDGPVYVSVDIDGLDPAFAPGVSHPEPGGLSTRQLLDVIQRLEGTVIGADIVEVNPNKDFQNLTATVAAKIVKEIAGKMLLGRNI